MATGTLTVEKFVSNGSDAGREFEFELSTTDGSPRINGSLNFVETFLADGDSETFNLLAGDYNLTEILPEGWFLDSIDITGDLDGGSSYSLEDATVLIDFDGNEFITVAYTNTQGAQITVAKNAIGPNGSTTDFSFAATGDTVNSSFTLSGGESLVLSSAEQSGYVRPGTYTLSLIHI